MRAKSIPVTSKEELVYAILKSLRDENSKPKQKYNEETERSEYILIPGKMPDPQNLINAYTYLYREDYITEKNVEVTKRFQIDTVLVNGDAQITDKGIKYLESIEKEY
ncbi:hypothetical protein GOQ27_15115 [Clostridium sp. D2Q-11]|uniref:Uncharacterized protein n=1 Tax=Anaeromonas frigoriresistens TaxID=2683708 RepID=A0A942UWD5_9FIRM|nr:hypothetical protein [Anaeromonas frigoriresistens]MBS4539803.1 hypothetical protein [Anaeromonas frigoriresistens]